MSAILSDLDQTAFHEALRDARMRNASDVHFSPGRPVGVRIDGKLSHRPGTRTSLATIEAYFGRVFNAAPVLRDKYETEGHATLADGDPENVGYGRVRVHAYRSSDRMQIAARLIPMTLDPLESMALLPPILKEIALQKEGLTVVAGRNGSGKTTLLNRLMAFRSAALPTDFTLMLENPRELLHAQDEHLGRIEQREFGTDFTSWPSAIEATTEENPDCVVVGQAKGAESIAASMRIGLTGIPGFVTTHTRDTTQVFRRFVEEAAGEKAAEVRANLIETLSYVVAVRLVDTETGVAGSRRVQTFEIMAVDDQIRTYLRSDGDATDAILDYMEDRTNKCITFEQHLEQLCRASLISAETARRAALRPSRLRLPRMHS